MRDLTPAEEDRLTAEWTTRLTEGWVGSDESLVWMLLLERGYAGSAVAGNVVVPQVPSPEVRPWAAASPKWPLPSDPVASGRFLNDEWADDPSIVWWAVADTADAVSVRFADHFAATHADAVLALTDQRLALVVERGKVGESQPSGDAEKGWLGRARAAAAQVQKTAEGIGSRKDAKLPVSYCEVLLENITSMELCHLGRTIPSSGFLRVHFVDRSTLLIRSLGVERLARKFAALRDS